MEKAGFCLQARSARSDRRGGLNHDYPIRWTVSIAMYLRERSQASRGARRAIRCLALLLTSACLPGPTLAGIGIRIQIGSTVDEPEEVESPPYLTSIGPPGLRFCEAQPLPPPTPPVAAAPPPPRPPPAELPLDASGLALAPTVGPKPAAASKLSEVNSDEPPPPSAASIKILPDTVRPQVQAEDFLPYFVVPDAVKSTSTPPVPTEPGKLPPSSATYIQTQK